MFVIAGLKTRISNIGSGRFHCPNEGADRPYGRRRARRWITLFFVPIIPLGRKGEWVQCRGCGVRYGPDVLQRHPSSRPA